MIKRGNNTSIHHIVPRSKWGNNESKNLIELKDSKHRALHTLFDNKLIAQQLLTTLDISAKAMRTEVLERLVDTLTSHDVEDVDFWYKDTTHF